MGNSITGIILAAALSAAAAADAAASWTPEWGGHRLGELYSPGKFRGCVRDFDELPSKRIHPPFIRKKIVAYCKKRAGRERARYYFVGEAEAVEKSRLYAIEVFFTDDGKRDRTRIHLNNLKKAGGRVAYRRALKGNTCTVLAFGTDRDGRRNLAVMRYFRHPDRHKNYARVVLVLMSYPLSREGVDEFTRFAGLCGKAVRTKWEEVPW